VGDLQLDRHFLKQLENREIPLGEILREKDFIRVDQLEEGLQVAQDQRIPLGVALLELGFISQGQLRIALEDQAAVKKITKMRSGRKRRLGDILMRAGVLTEEQLAGALEFAVAHGVRIGEALVQLGIVTEDELAQSVGEQLMIPYIKLAKTPPDPLVLENVQTKLAHRHQVMPVKLEDENLYLAMVDPQNILVIDDVEKSTGFNVVPMIVSEKDFNNSYEAHYGEGAQTENLIEMIEDEDDKDLDAMLDENFDEDSAPIRSLMNKVVSQAVEQGASDIHIEPFEYQLVMRYRIDGMLRKGAGPFPATVAMPIASRIKVMAGLDISEVRQPQDGKFRMSLKGKIIDVRISTCPTSWGEKIVMRILDQSGSRLRLNSLGLDPENLSSLQEGLAAPNGIILVTGPTGSGKTTTLYSSLVTLNKPSVNIQTAEDPVEYDLPGIAQTACISEIGMNFSKVLKAFLRQDPDVILIGEIRDMETAEIALKAALTGHLVLSTLHTNSAVESIGRLLNMGIDRFLITSAIRVILAQRLMRRLCDKCKIVQKFSQRELKVAGIHERLMEFHGACDYALDGLRLYQPKGCEECLDVGYRGRIGIHEVMRMTENVALGINQELSVPDLTKAARADGMMSLRDSALIRAVQGLSSLEEVDRLTINEERFGASDGDEELISEILIRSGSWKLSPKELLTRRKQGKYIPGAKGKLGASSEDVNVIEAEAHGLQIESLDGSLAPAPGYGSHLFQNLLEEIKSFGESMGGGSSGAVDIGPVLETAIKTLQRSKEALSPETRSQVEGVFLKLESCLDLIRLYQAPVELVKKQTPLVEAFVKDVYQKLPRIATALFARLEVDFDFKKLRCTKRLQEEGFLFASDWSVLRTAFVLVLENHLEELVEGGDLKIKSQVIEKSDSVASRLEFIIYDNGKGLKGQVGNEALEVGFSTRNRLGLGLAVARKILEAHGAEILVRGKEGKGFQTRLSFPQGTS
jgi:type IV pilus assembly protein PilB